MAMRDWRATAFSQAIILVPRLSLLTVLEQLHYQQGEKRLMLAVLMDAVTCIERYHSERGARSLPTYRAALRWVLAQDQEWLFSFENICLALDLDPGRLRSALCPSQQ
jgi:hypothetical protein